MPTELTSSSRRADLDAVVGTERAASSPGKTHASARMFRAALVSLSARLWPWRAVVLAVLLYVLVNAAALALDPFFLRLTTYDWQFTTARIANYDTGTRPDVIFMGTSRTSLGFNPTIADDEIQRLTGLQSRSLNLGITGGAIDVNELILKNIIRRDKQPSVIVYGVTDIELSELTDNDLNRIPYSSFLLRPDDILTHSGTGFDQKASFVLKQVCPLCRSTEAIRNGLSIAFNPDDPNHRAFAPGPAQQIPPDNGYFDSGDRHASAAALETEQQTYQAQLRPFRISYDRLLTFDAFLKQAKARGIQVILINMPVAPGFLDFWDNADSIDRYRAVVRGIAQDHDVPLLDLYANPSGAFSADAFVDRNHLNSEGAAALTRLVVDQYVVPTLASSVPIADPATFYGAHYAQFDLPSSVAAGQMLHGGVTVENQSSRVWPAGDDFFNVRLALRWRDTSGTELDLPTARASLRGALPPDQHQQIFFDVQAPPTPGAYILDVGLVYEGVAFFSDKGVPPLTQAVQVVPD